MPARKHSPRRHAPGVEWHPYPCGTRSSPAPFRLIASSYDASANPTCATLEQLFDVKGWPEFELDPRPIWDSFPPEKVVYLSPDAEEVLGAVEEGSVYVIGCSTSRAHRAAGCPDTAR